MTTSAHGTTTLFAALDIATGNLPGLCKPAHTHKEFLSFLKHVARTYSGVELHLVMDNYATHKKAEFTLGSRSRSISPRHPDPG